MAKARAYRREMTLAIAWMVSLSLLAGCDTDRLAGGRPAPTPVAEASGKLHQCGACHGDEGVSSAELFPNLAGQQQGYIAAQLTAFRDHTRQDQDAKTYMWGMARGLSDATIKAFAVDYASKSPAVAAAGDKAAAAAGAVIYEKGVAAHGVLACVSCHGPDANGNAVIPGLAGQHEDYLRIQLAAFASGSRDNAAMHLIAKVMTPKEMRAVSVYLSSR